MSLEPFRLRPFELQYLRVLAELVEKASGPSKPNRTGTPTVGGFGCQLDVNLIDHLGSLPALVTKSVHLPSVAAELCWFLRGETNVDYLHQHGCKIWDEWADSRGSLGPIYGEQWRAFGGYYDGDGYLERGNVDQIANLVDGLRNDPYSRRHIVSAWNPVVLPKSYLTPQLNASAGHQALAPCHMLFQCLVHDLTLHEREKISGAYGVPPLSHDTSALDPRLSEDDVKFRHTFFDKAGVPRQGLMMRVDQRSADWFLGVPFNIASYGLLTYILADTVGMVPSKLVMQFGDYHLYENHVDQALQQLDNCHRSANREPGTPILQYPSVSLKVNQLSFGGIYTDIGPQDIVFTDYQSWGRIPAPVAV